MPTRPAFGMPWPCFVQVAWVAFPTETVYGLGADAASESGVAWIYRIRAGPSAIR
ncbi:MAG: Sua5/YciO/YrdC/YwlC family protein [Burkholderiaceae bacterium]